MVDPSTGLRTGIVRETAAGKPLRRKDGRSPEKTAQTEAKAEEWGEFRLPGPDEPPRSVGAYT
jgi:hypothetical protein